MNAPSPSTEVRVIHGGACPFTIPPAPLPAALAIEPGPRDATLIGAVALAGLLTWGAIFAAGWYAGRTTPPTIACGVEVLS